MHAVTHRVFRSKAVYNYTRDDFVTFALQVIDTEYSNDPLMLTDYEIMDEAMALLKTSSKPSATKRRISNKLSKLAEYMRPVTTHTDAFIKKEVTIDESWPRLVAARTELIRQIDAPIYEIVQHQVYQNRHFIKGLDDENIIQTLLDRLAPYQIILCLDFSAYDSAQSGDIWKIEDKLFNKIVGERAADIHRQIALDHNLIISSGFIALTPTTRNSGEMTTSLTNTLLNSLLIRYAMQRLDYDDYDYFVEGDDSIIGMNHDHADSICGILSGVGFQTTIESKTRGLHGASFCKIKFFSKDQDFVAWRDPITTL